MRKRVRLLSLVAALVAALVATAVWSTGATAAPGDLDPTFGASGESTVTFPTPRNSVRFSPLAVSGDGSVVGVTGRVGADGQVLAGGLPSPPGNYNYYDVGAGVQPDGRVVLVYLTDATRVWVTRLIPSGEIDASFATRFVSIPSGDALIAGSNQVVVQYDGRIVVAHTMSGQVARNPSGSPCIELIRVFPDGGIDPSFGAGGFAQSCAGGTTNALVAAPNGDLLLTAVVEPAGPHAVVAFRADGAPDSGFGSAGVVPLANAPVDLVAQPDGKVVVATVDGSVRRFSTNGQPDTSFAVGGVAHTTIPGWLTATGLVLRPDGLIGLLGYSQDLSTTITDHLLLYDATGHLVSSFGTGGDAHLPVHVPGLGGHPAAVQCRDEVVVDAGAGAAGSVQHETLARIQMPPPPSSAGIGGYVLDAGGGLHPFAIGSSGTAPPAACGAPALYGEFAQARGLAMLPDGSAALVVDAWGGVHPASATGAAPGSVTGSAYWPGWDIARGIVVARDSTGSYVLDAWGGLHPAGYGAVPAPPMPTTTAYWPGWDIARAVSLLPDNSGGYVLDGWGGLHPFGTHTGPPIPAASTRSYFRDFDIARAVSFLPDGSGGYVLDGWGGLHPFGVGAQTPPPAAGATAYWPGWDIARGLVILPDGSGGYVVDAWGGLHPFGIGAHAPPPAPSGGLYWTAGIARAAAVSP